MMTELKILHQEKLNDSITAFAVESPYPRPDVIKFGIDPGTANMGVAFVHPISNVTIMLYQIKMKRGDTLMDRVLSAQNMLTQCKLILQPSAQVIIEGAGYMASHFRQVELEDVRVAVSLWFHRMGVKNYIVPPNTIRKQVFGHGRIKNPWSNIPDDVAAALGCAYYEISEK
jgi:Holliday junction resolvasome RuvABC endonuclease subunit